MRHCPLHVERGGGREGNSVAAGASASRYDKRKPGGQQRLLHMDIEALEFADALSSTTLDQTAAWWPATE